MEAPGSGDPAPPRLDAVALKLPPYWPSDPALWFAHIESQFATRGVSCQLTKFHYVVSALSPAEAAEVRDIIMTPPASRPFDRLKEELVRRTTASEQRRLQQLITSEELGDRKPSQLLRRMQQLLGNHASSVDASIVRELFLQRLPSNVRMILSSSDSIPLDELAQLADKIMDNMSLSIATPALSAVVAQPEEQSELARLRADVAKLTELVISSLRIPRSRSPSPAPPRTRSSSFRRRRRSPRPSDPDSTLCWYHEKFGDRAHKCTPPCSFPGNRLANN
ncbi:uncharacterized protein LOC135395311 [Ornithodoros turicata]|uniref:uncharacterized protein LOC135395311 n=1 Tax=Ornithodoros turicata TaxID=34597 RepID=UPI003139B507